MELMAPEIQQGFKQTEVGMIPEDWNLYELDEIAHFKNGKAHEQFIDERGEYIVVNSKFISTEGAIKKFSSFNIEPLTSGEITIVMSDIPNGKALAKCYLITANGRYTLNQRIGAITSKEGVDNGYLFYKLNRNEYYLAFDSGSGQTNLRREEVLKCQIPLPPTLREQQAIAEALSDMDAMIRSLERLIEKKKAIKQGAMQELLRPKEGWLGIVIGNELKIPATYGIVKAGDFTSEGILMVRGGDIKGGKVDVSEMPRVSAEKSLEFSRTVLEKNDVVIALVGYPGEAAKIQNELIGSNISRAVGLLRFKVSLDPNFMVQLLNSGVGRKAVLAPSAGSAQIVVNLHELNKLKFKCPDINEQERIAHILDEINLDIVLANTKLTKTRQLKQGMMQDLLTGKKRLV